MRVTAGETESHAGKQRARVEAGVKGLLEGLRFDLALLWAMRNRIGSPARGVVICTSVCSIAPTENFAIVLSGSPRGVILVDSGVASISGMAISWNIQGPVRLWP